MTRYSFSDERAADTYTVRVKDGEGNTLHTHVATSHAEAEAFKVGWGAVEQQARLAGVRAGLALAVEEVERRADEQFALFQQTKSPRHADCTEALTKALDAVRAIDAESVP